MQKQIERFDIREEGIVATLFMYNSLKRLPVVITLGGGSGGLSESRAQLLASHGFAALSLAYFGAPGLPLSLEEIPLEYFEKTIRWLQAHPRLDPERLGLWGSSRGAELSLLIGSLFPDKIKAIAAYVPSSVIYGSLIHPEKPAWIYRGLSVLPNAPFVLSASDLRRLASENKPIALTPFFLEGMKQSSSFAASAIPVERLQSPLLLISGEKDQMWPSHLFACQIQERLKKKASLIEYSHFSYPGAGHFISPFSDHKSQGQIASMGSLQFDFGGNPEEDRRASIDAWAKTLEFFSRVFLFC